MSHRIVAISFLLFPLEAWLRLTRKPKRQW